MSELQVEKLINENKVVTHCNHYTWTWREFYQSLKVYKPDWYTLTSEFLDAFDTKDEDAKVANIFEHFETERIEVLTKQLFNKGKGICMILPFHWEHITTWDDIYHYYIQNNIKTHNTKVIEIDSKNNLIISDNNKLIAMIGMEDFVLVETKDVIFISPRNKISEIKDLLDTIDSSGSKKYL